MKKVVLGFILFFGFTIACISPLDKNSQVLPSTENATVAEDPNGEVILGNKTEDPHVLRHMEKSLKELIKKDARYSKIVVKSNYKYVKIIPINEEGVNEINELKKFHFYHYPLDYEIKKHGPIFSEINNNAKYHSYWVVVPVKYSFSSNIKENLLEEVFMPFGIQNDEIKYDTETESLYKAIEENSYANLYPKSKKAKVNATYSGTLAVEDDTLSQIVYGVNSAGNFNSKIYLPLKGITIRARNLLTTNSTTTGLSGEFLFSRNWLGGVDEYTICWENVDFCLLKSNNDAAITSYNSGISNTWNAKFGKKDMESFRYAHVYRGAYFYYNISNDQFQRPPKMNGGVLYCAQRTQVPIKVENGSQSSHKGYLSYACQANVTVQNTLFTTIPTTDIGFNNFYPFFKGYYMFASVCHELTHLKHWTLNGGMTDNKYCLANTNMGGPLAESYALMGEYFLVNKEYTEQLQPYSLTWLSNNFDREGYQRKELVATGVLGWNYTAASCINPTNLQRFYTPYFIDLIDSRNQSITNGNTRPNDKVSGYTAKFLEECIKTAPDDWYAIHAKIKNPSTSAPVLTLPSAVSGNSATNIDYLFNTYKLL